jgi:hypothetical protein
MPPKPDNHKLDLTVVRLFKCPMLTGKADFEPWWALMEDLFYSAGWADLWDDALEDIDLDDDDQLVAVRLTSRYGLLRHPVAVRLTPQSGESQH